MALVFQCDRCGTTHPNMHSRLFLQEHPVNGPKLVALSCDLCMACHEDIKRVIKTHPGAIRNA